MSQNSQVCRVAKSLYVAIVADIAAGRPSSFRYEMERDLLTIHSRLDSEGLSFLTKTLPSLGKAIQRALVTGVLECPSSFQKKPKSSLPKLFWGLMKDIFLADGTLRSDPCIASITEVMQLTRMCYKLQLPFSEEQLRIAYDSFVVTDEEMSTVNKLIDSEPPPILEEAREIITYWLRALDLSNVKPTHGPGALATREKGMGKWRGLRLVPQIHLHYDPSVLIRRPSEGDLPLMTYSSVSEISARLTSVPKDSRGPRLISMEPLMNQFYQQGQWKRIEPFLSSHPFSKGHVNFKDQGINRGLAIIGSISGSWDTIDMKDASDRISLSLVKYLFKYLPKTLDFLLCTRSSATTFPSGLIHMMHKFAPMGSALCFPMESIVHFAIAVAAVRRQGNFECTAEGLLKARSHVYVYGDDIIVSPSYTASVIEALESVGMVVNKQKCCTSGFFRESCGIEAYKGHDTVPIYWRKLWSLPLAAETAASFTEFARQLYCRGYWHSAYFIWGMLERHIPFPTVHRSLSPSVLAAISNIRGYTYGNRIRYNKRYQRREVVGVSPKRCTIRCEDIPDDVRLLKWFLTGDGANKEVSAYLRLQRQWQVF